MSRSRIAKTKELETLYLKHVKESMKPSIQHAINLYSIGTIVQYNTARNLIHDLTSNTKSTRNLALKQLEKISGQTQDKAIKTMKQMEKEIERLDKETKQLENKRIIKCDIQYLTYAQVEQDKYKTLPTNRRRFHLGKHYAEFGSLKTGIVKAPYPFPQDLLKRNITTDENTLDHHTCKSSYDPYTFPDVILRSDEVYESSRAISGYTSNMLYVI